MMNDGLQNYFKESVIQLHGYSSPPQGSIKAKLNQNESPFDVPDRIKQVIYEKAKSLEWNRYPRNESPTLKTKLAQWLDVKPDQLLLGNGSNQLLQTILSATLSSGDKVLYSPPSFSLFDIFPILFDAGRIEIFKSKDLDFPVDRVLDTIKKQTPKLVLLCSPNNPTGGQISLDVLHQICKVSKGLVLWDEAYAEFTDQTALSVLGAIPNLIISRTFSKAFSIAGLRFGYLISHPQLIQQLQKANLPYNVNLFTELVATTLLDHLDLMNEHIEFLKNEKIWLYNEMKKIPKIKIYPSAANFILFKCYNAASVFAKLKDKGVVVREVSEYPRLDNHLRVSVGLHKENELFVQSLNEVL